MLFVAIATGSIITVLVGCAGVGFGPLFAIAAFVPDAATVTTPGWFPVSGVLIAVPATGGFLTVATFVSGAGSDVSRTVSGVALAAV